MKLKPIYQSPETATEITRLEALLCDSLASGDNEDLIYEEW